MYFKIHKSYRNVVAVCDENLVGKRFEEGKLQLDVRENFFKGEALEDEKIVQLLILEAREDSTFNIIGEKAIELALKAGVISKTNISQIASIPFAITLV